MKNTTIIILLVLYSPLFSQVKKEAPLPIIDKTAEVNYGYRKSSNRKIDIVVVHSTYSVSKDSFEIDAVLSQFK